LHKRKTIMTFEEFEVYFWSYIPENIVSNLDRRVNHRDFCDAVCFDCYRIHEQSNVNKDTLCKLAENILFNVNRYKPLLGN